MVLNTVSYADKLVTASSEPGEALAPGWVALTGDEAPEVQPDGAVQGFVRTAKSIEHEETCSHQSKDDQYCTEENDTNMDTCRDNFEQIRKN